MIKCSSWNNRVAGGIDLYSDYYIGWRLLGAGGTCSATTGVERRALYEEQIQF
jgi:hypothetical protein